jgi:hypothetical protein
VALVLDDGASFMDEVLELSDEHEDNAPPSPAPRFFPLLSEPESPLLTPPPKRRGRPPKVLTKLIQHHSY